MVTTTQEEHDLVSFREALLDLELDGKIVGILHTKNDSNADVVRNDGTEVLYGQDYFYEELLGLRFRVSEFSFSRQIHMAQRCFIRWREIISARWATGMAGKR